MTDDNAPAPQFSRDIMFYAARGFIQGLSRSLRYAFLALFGGDYATAAISDSLEQAVFELGQVDHLDQFAPVLAALDYALPRMTSAGWTVATEIERLWDTFPERTRALVREKIENAIRNGRSGEAVDTAHWARLARLPVNDAERAVPTEF